MPPGSSEPTRECGTDGKSDGALLGDRAAPVDEPCGSVFLGGTMVLAHS